MQVDFDEAKTRFAQFVEAAIRGETIVLAEAGTTLAKRVPLGAAGRPKIRFGGMKGQFSLADDFDVPPYDVLAAFQGRDPP